MSKNLTSPALTIGRSERETLLGQVGKIIWFTGLSGSGKSTLANSLEVELHKKGFHTFLLDGDVVRLGLNADLGFSDEDRTENIRRIAHTAKLMMDAGLIVICAFISPFQKERDLARQLGGEHFLEIYLSTPLQVCAERDTKGLYKKAGSGELKNLSGMGSQYEVPSKPELVLDTSKLTISQSVESILTRI